MSKTIRDINYEKIIMNKRFNLIIFVLFFTVFINCKQLDLQENNNRQNINSKIAPLNLSGDKTNMSPFHLGLLYYKQKDMDKAKYYLSIAAQEKNTLAQNALGFIYNQEKDIKKAKYYFKLAAKQNYVLSQINLALIYQNINKLNKAKYYYSCAAELGNVAAQIILADLCIKDSDKDKAIYYYMLAAKTGNNLAKKKIRRTRQKK